MIPFPVAFYRVGNSFEPEAIALFDRMAALGEEPDGARKEAINDFIKAEKLAGNWDEYDYLLFPAAHGINSSGLNWVQNAVNWSNFTNIIFTQNYGWRSSGSSTSVNYSGITNKNIYNNGSYGIYCLNNLQDNSNDIGMSDGATRWLITLRDTSNRTAYRVSNGTTSNVTGITNSIGLTVGRRVLDTEMELWKNGVKIATTSSATTTGTLSSITFPRLSATREYAFAFSGSGQINLSAQYTNVINYLTAIGAI
jgi:hypothetical protein